MSSMIVVGDLNYPNQRNIDQNIDLGTWRADPDRRQAKKNDKQTVYGVYSLILRLEK